MLAAIGATISEQSIRRIAMTIRLLLPFLVLICSTVIFAQPLKVTTVDGGSVVTELGYNIKVNEKSTLRRAWVVINDTKSPVQLEGSGVTTKYGDREYQYKPTGTMTASEPIVAFNVRFVLYDVFGMHIKTLDGKEVRDIPANAPYQLKDIGSWRAWENEVSELLTVISFVAQVRTASGKLWRYNDKVVEEELSKIQLKVSTGVLEPTKEK